MLIQENPPVHLTYCMNVHPGESWGDILATIKYKVPAVRKAVAPDRPFGLGLRLGHPAALELSRPKNIQALKHVLERQDMYVFTINGFPYGDFHRHHLKRDVFAPDWRTEDRRDYTMMLADILAALLPQDHITGSISTVPCSFRSWPDGLDDISLMLKNLLEVIVHLALLADKTSRIIQLALEPEPDGYLENAHECIEFICDQLLRWGPDFVSHNLACDHRTSTELIRRHLGLCLDTCHAAVQFEEPMNILQQCRTRKVSIPKIQLTAALECVIDEQTPSVLSGFAEDTYLHQTRIRGRKSLRSWPDLPDVLDDLAYQKKGSLLRCHYHVPLFWEGTPPLRSTRSVLSPAFMRQLKKGASPHLELETYTFNILPPEIKPSGLQQGIIREFEWFMDQWNAT